MGLVARLKRITSARIEAFLANVEDPAEVLPQLERELRSSVRVAANAEVKATAALKSTQRQLDELMGKIMRLQRGAELALRCGDEETAREALEEQVRAERLLEKKEASVKQAKSALQGARDARLQLDSQLEELTSRKGELLARAQRAHSQLTPQQVERDHHRHARGRLLDTIARIETDSIMDEAWLDVQRQQAAARSRSLDERLMSLEKEQRIENRMRELRERNSKKRE